MQRKVFFCALALVFAFVPPARVGAGQPEESLPDLLRAAPMGAKPGDDELRKLRVEKYNFALAEVKKRHKNYEFTAKFYGGGTDQAMWRLFDADLALATSPAERVRACQRYLELAKYLERSLGELEKSGSQARDPAALEIAGFLRADAEIRLIGAKRAAGNK